MTTNKSPADNDEISLIEIGIALGEQKKVLFGIPAITTSIALAYALLAPPVYTARTLILPPQQQQSATNSMLASLGSLADLAGAAVAIKSPEEMYVALFKSRSVEDEVIKQLDLPKHYKATSHYETRRELESNIRVSADKATGLITVAVEDHDATFAAKVANAEVTALRHLLSRIAVTSAQQRRNFFAQQIQNTEKALANADNRFRYLSAQGGLPVTEALAQSEVQTSAALRARITATEIELAAVRQFTTTQNPDSRRLTTQLNALRDQLNKLDQGGGSESTASPKGVSAITALRDLKTQQAVLEVMTRQYEMAKVDEAREGPLLQQIDLAERPSKQSHPKRGEILTFGALIGMLLGVLSALALHAIKKIGANQVSSRQLATLRRLWIGR